MGRINIYGNQNSDYTEVGWVMDKEGVWEKIPSAENVLDLDLVFKHGKITKLNT